jgi:hypothetical protein
MQDAVPFIPYLILVVLTAIPGYVLFKRIGFSPAWTLLSIVPLGMLIILWIVAYRRWPNSRPQKGFREAVGR